MISDLFGFAVAHLGWRPADFYGATPREYWAAAQAVEAAQPKRSGLINTGGEAFG